MAYEQVEVLTHSAIRIKGSQTVYFDPFQLAIEPHDADVVFITHDHHDHYSVDDVRKVVSDVTQIIVPIMMAERVNADFPENPVTGVIPGQHLGARGMGVETVAAYNVGKHFHPKENAWVGYVISLDGVRYFVTGDCDAEPENLAVDCDVVLVPVGGTYTFDAREAAAYVNELRPKAAIPTHYGSIVGTVADAEEFMVAVDPSIEVEIRMCAN